MDLEATLTNTVIQNEQSTQTTQTTQTDEINESIKESIKESVRESIKSFEYNETVQVKTEDLNEKQLEKQEPPMIFDIISERGGLIYDLLHAFDDLYVYSRTVIENNYFNFANNEDFNMVYPGIYIGNYSTSTNLGLLQNLGITHIIPVIPTFNPPFQDKFKYYHIPAYDDESQDLSTHFEKCNQYIREVLETKGKILIHCMVGRSRSVTIFLAFLISLIKSNFNQDNIKMDLDNVVSNEIDYRRFGNQALGVTADGIKGMSTKIGDGSGSSGSGSSENENIEINKMSYDRPQFGDKVKNFIRYKKEGMISEVEELRCKYNVIDREIKDFSSMNSDEVTIKKLKDTLKNNLMVQIFKYVRKYRKEAAPNEYFLDQLLNLL